MKKPKEWLTTGSVTIEFEIATMGKSAADAQKVATQILAQIRTPQSVRIGVGKRSRIEHNLVDYFLDLFTPRVNDDITTDLQNECCRNLR